jgi:hypothetical protein
VWACGAVGRTAEVGCGQDGCWRWARRGCRGGLLWVDTQRTMDRRAGLREASRWAGVEAWAGVAWAWEEGVWACKELAGAAVELGGAETALAGASAIPLAQSSDCR